MASFATGAAGRHAVLFRHRERRRAAQDFTAFDALRATPTVLGNVAAGASAAVTVTLPANTRLAVALDDVTVAEDITLSDAVNTVAGGGGVADFVQDVQVVFPKDRVITVNRDAGCPAGDFILFVLNEWHEAFPIATATFT